jgi:hypothetical protein
MNAFWSNIIVSPTPGVLIERNRSWPLSGNSCQDIGFTIVSVKAMPRTRPGWRAAQSKASAPPQSWPTSTRPPWGPVGAIAGACALTALLASVLPTVTILRRP